MLTIWSADFCCTQCQQKLLFEELKGRSEIAHGLAGKIIFVFTQRIPDPVSLSLSLSLFLPLLCLLLLSSVCLYFLLSFFLSHLFHSHASSRGAVCVWWTCGLQHNSPSILWNCMHLSKHGLPQPMTFIDQKTRTKQHSE